MLGVLIVGVTGFVLHGLSDFDLTRYKSQDVTFGAAGSSISGTLHLPQSTASHLALLVHGDGPADRDLNGALLPLIGRLLEDGVAVFSWDKPGVGSSTGNWLDHSIQDRADLAAVALQTLQKLPELKDTTAGYIGFSQAGWVLPLLAKNSPEANFFVIVGGAVNWLDQGRYFTRRKLELRGHAENEIQRKLDAQRIRSNALLSPSFTYNDYLALTPLSSPMLGKRFAFVRRNASADASVSLAHTNAPFLIVHGAQDMNVDPDGNQLRYQSLLQGRNRANTYVLVPHATHGLLRAGLFNYQLPDEIPAWRQAAFLALGRKAYAPGALEAIVDWIKERRASKEIKGDS
ncbi:hypothetical protein JM93_02977 [Roseibium hamelinense]|uniref:Serine aminopeptidase S33 domain-containing protein n=1 Tax=Roseibium hamelinense TaxID=150831 RepID=A0A562SU64_9HYPH|nr:hypothetical protein JM93_02977 [Roseibium hamelinense]